MKTMILTVSLNFEVKRLRWFELNIYIWTHFVYTSSQNLGNCRIIICSLSQFKSNFSSFQNTVPTSDDVVAIINLLNQMTALLAMELSALTDESELPSLNDQYDSLLSSEPSSLGINPCLDILLSENILSHVLAASRMPITPDQQDQLRSDDYFEN